MSGLHELYGPIYGGYIKNCLPFPNLLWLDGIYVLCRYSSVTRLFILLKVGCSKSSISCVPYYWFSDHPLHIEAIWTFWSLESSLWILAILFVSSMFLQKVGITLWLQKDPKREVWKGQIGISCIIANSQNERLGLA